MEKTERVNVVKEVAEACRQVWDKIWRIPVAMGPGIAPTTERPHM